MKHTTRLAAAMIVSGAFLQAQEVPLEYQIKAAYLANFIRFVEWPRDASSELTICVAQPDPFDGLLGQTLAGQRIEGRPVTVRTISEPEARCNAIFVPQDAPLDLYLRAARGTPVLTVGETPDFVMRGGLVTFVRDSGHVRFVIDGNASHRAGLRISSRLLRLARLP